jgi:hypothetical protein
MDLEVLKHFDKVQLVLKFCIREGYIYAILYLEVPGITVVSLNP